VQKSGQSGGEICATKGQGACASTSLRIDKKTGETSTEVVYGLTDHSPQSADASRLLAFNRAHWGIEAHHYILDWSWDEDRCTIRSGHGPENITRLRRFAVGLIKSKGSDSVAATIDKLARNVRRVFDYLPMTRNSTHDHIPSLVLPGRTDLPWAKGGCEGILAARAEAGQLETDRPSACVDAVGEGAERS